MNATDLLKPPTVIGVNLDRRKSCEPTASHALVVEDDNEIRRVKSDIELEREVIRYQGELEKLKEKMRVKEESYVLEIEMYKDSREKQGKQMERIQVKAAEYKEQCIDLENKLEVAVKSKLDPSQLPSAVRQLENKVRELKKEKTELEKNYEERISELQADNNTQTQRAIQLAASNAALINQLQDALENVDYLNEELALFSNKEIVNIKLEQISTIFDDILNLKSELQSMRLNFIKEAEMMKENVVCISENVKNLNAERLSTFDEVNNTLRLKDLELNKLRRDFDDLQKTYNAETVHKNDVISKIESELQILKTLKNEAQSENENILQTSKLKSSKIMELESEITSLSSQIKQVQSQLVALQEDSDELSAQLAEKQCEIKSQSNTCDVLQNELQSCHCELKSVSESKKLLEKQLEEITNNNMEAEYKLSQFIKSIEAITNEKEEALTENKQNLEKIDDLEKNLKDTKLIKEELAAGLESKIQIIQELEQQISFNSKELEAFEVKQTNLNADKIEMNKEMQELKAKLSSSELEKNLLQKELTEIQESEQSLLKRLIDFQKINSALESEKRNLQSNLDNIMNTQNKMDHEMTVLHQQNQSNEDEVEHLRLAKRLLADQVQELDKNLQEMELICLQLRKEKDGFRQEAMLLNEAFVKSRQTLAEVQIQRGKLNQSIAKVAQEKVELVQENMQLSSKVNQLEEIQQSTLQSSAAATEENNKLKSQMEELEVEVTSLKEEIEYLQKAKVTLQDEKKKQFEEQKESNERQEAKVNSMIEKHTNELHKLRKEIQIKETEYQSQLASVKKSHKLELAELENSYSQDFQFKEIEWKNSIEKLKQDLNTLNKEYSDEITKISTEKQTACSNLEMEIQMLKDKINQQKAKFEEELQEIKKEKEAVKEHCSELKHQLEVSEGNNDDLSNELTDMENQIDKLQEMMDKLKFNAENEINELHVKISASSKETCDLQEEIQEYQLTIKRMETSLSCYKKCLQEAQEEYENTSLNYEREKAEKVNLQKKIEQLQKSHQKAIEEYNCVEKLLNDNTEKQLQLKNECKQLRKSLQFTEQSLSQLAVEHQSLEASFTACQKELNILQIEMPKLEQENAMLQEENDINKNESINLKCRLEVLLEEFNSKDEELSDYKEKLQNLIQERDELKASISLLEETSELKHANQLDHIQFLEGKLEDSKDQKVKMMKNLQMMEIGLERELRNIENIQKEKSSIESSRRSLEKELKSIKNSYQELHANHSKYLAVIQSSINIEERNILENLYQSYSADEEVMKFPSPQVLKKAMEKLQKEMNELKNLNNSLKEELEGVNRELQESIASKLQIESQLKESCKLQKSLKIANEKLTGVAKEYEDLKLEMHGFSKKYNKTLEELEFYKLSSQMAESRLKKYINEIAGKEVEKREMQNKMKDVEFTLNEELNGLRKEVKESKEVITQRELEATVREAKERIEQLEEKLIDKEQLIESVTIGRNNIEVQFKQMLKKVDDIEREKKSLLTRAMESEKLFKVLKGNEKSHKHKLADERHNDGDQQIISKLRMKVEKYEEEKKIANSRMLQLKSIIDELSLARELSEEKERSSKEAKEILEKNITTLQLSLDAEYMGHSLTCENYEDLNEKFEHLKQEIVETCAERDKLKFQLDEALKQLKETENLVKKMKESSEMMSAASKKNIELTSKVRELERKLLSEDTTHHKEYQLLKEEHAKELEMLKISQKMQQTQWESCEQEYKKTVKQVERKAALFEGKFLQMKRSRDELINKAEKQEKAIANFQKVLSRDTKRPQPV